MPITILEHEPVNASNIQRRKQKQGKDLTLCSHDPLRRNIAFQNYGEKNLPSQNKSARKRKEKSQGKILQNCNFSLSVCGAFRAVGGNTCGLKTSMKAGKLGKICLIPVREAGLNFFLVGSYKSAVPSGESFCRDTLLLYQWVPSILSSITPFTLFLRRHMVKETFCISAKYIKIPNLCASKAQLSKLI